MSTGEPGAETETAVLACVRNSGRRSTNSSSANIVWVAPEISSRRATSCSPAMAASSAVGPPISVPRRFT
ncbi:Uncharacterised protein [Mycobacteroides abscessus subsp. massiliense]|nr:Uncharacterised protein [Mycobacteroides abscessus subsp. massiliense]